jgi:hypothetical protein
MKLKYYLILLFLFSLCIEHLTFNITYATVRYVSKTGTSTPPYTSWETAADSIQKCINICGDGDTIYVGNGIYKENLVINTAISLIGSSMDSTVIDGRGLANRTIEANSIFTLSTFKIFGNGEGITNSIGIYVNGDSVNINKCQISEVRAGIIVGNNCNIEDVTILSSHYGFAHFGASSASNIILNNNVFILKSENAIGINLGAGNYFITKNIIISDCTINPGSGISTSLTKKVNISNNIISGFADNIDISIQIVDSLIIRNNILYYHNPGQGNSSIHSINDDPFVENVILANNKVALYGWPIQSNYNLFWKNDVDRLNGALGDSDIVADPMFINDTIPTTNGDYDYHLQKYSPAIDKGDPAIFDVDGSRSDIGLFGGPLGESYTYQDLAPKPPRNLTASMDSGLVHLKWNKNTETDLFRYRVYRDTVPDFVYDTTKIIAVISDTTFYDDPPQKFISGNYYYKITAIDSAYHQSPASEEAHINITGIPEAPPIVVEHYSLLQNYPNPFNPSTTIPYRLKAPGYVKVMVYNLLGEQVKVLVIKYQSAGYYEVLFHPTTTERQSAEGKIEFETGYGDIVSGIYLYRIEVIGEGNIPVFTDMKKMMMIK